MFSKVSFCVIAMVTVMAIVMAVPAMAQEYTQLRYFKTTDYGASWSDLSQAGDISTVFATTQGLPDFDAVVMANDELCYAVWLDNETAPGIYSLAGPGYTPVLAVPEGTNHFGLVGNSGGWSSIGMTPNGDLFIVVWALAGADSSNLLIGAKSTDNGATWGTPFTIATDATLPAGNLYPQLAQMNSATLCFVQLQDENYEQYVLTFPVAGGAGTLVDLGAASGSEYSYYIGSCQPIAYDPDNNALYVCFRNSDLSGVAIYYSANMGTSFDEQSVSAAQRYPAMALNPATQTPYVFSNYGVPTTEPDHYAWYAYDQGNYGGGLWSDPVDYASVPYLGNSEGLIYVNEGYWWDADHGVSSHNYWAALTPNGLYTNRTTDGGSTWIDMDLRYMDTEVDLTNVNNWGLTGGTNGVAFVFSCGRHAAPDLEGPTYSDATLVTPSTDPGPWEMTALVTDANNDTSDIHLTWFTASDSDTVSSPSNLFVITDPNTNSGTATFFIPADQPHGGAAYATGDTIWFYLWARDMQGNNGRSNDMALVVGGEFLGVDEHVRPDMVQSFALRGNYPNPFNPTTQIVFDLPGAATVTLKVYNTVGQQVAVLADRQAFTQGRHNLAFDGANLPSGMYFYRLTAGPYSASSKMLLLK